MRSPLFFALRSHPSSSWANQAPPTVSGPPTAATWVIRVTQHRLDQITAGNFDDLEVAWRFKTDNLGPMPEFRFQSTPLVVGGKLYSTGGSRRAVVALDAATGELNWVYSLDEGERGEAAPRQLSGRGLAYWSGVPDRDEARIIYVTPGYRLIALDAQTGRPVPDFGVDGMVDLKRDNDQQIDLTTGEVGLHATPIVAGDVIVVGAAHRTGGNPRSRSNVKGYVRGYDARTGERLWTFHTIPRPGEFGRDTWLADSAVYTGNTGVWAQISVDLELGLAPSLHKVCTRPTKSHKPLCNVQTATPSVTLRAI